MSGKRATSVNRRSRFLRVVRLFLRLMVSFAGAYARARLTRGAYDFLQDRDQNRRRARWIRAVAIDMGGVIIKVGQFLSTRVDLLPDEYIEELSMLQDEVPPVSFPEVQAVIEASFALPLSEVFAEIDPVPIAAASLGQAHRGRLWGGQRIVIKVKRPLIREIVEADLAALSWVVNQLNHWRAVRTRVDLPGILREFRISLHEELDYIAEAHNAERLALVFSHDDRVRIPRIYWSHVRSDVITLEYTPGIKINDYERLESNGISRSSLAELLLQTYLQQILVSGFFHADPHPGNVFVQPGPVLTLVDFGMMGRLPTHTRDDLRDVFVAIVRRDFEAVVRGLVRLHFVRPGSDLGPIRRAVVWTVDTFYQMSFGELRDVDPREILDQTYDLFRAQAFQIPTNFAFLGRAIGTLSGLCTGLDPNFQFADVAAPYARTLIVGSGSPITVLKRVGKEIKEVGMTAARIPKLSEEVLEGFADAEWLRRDLSNVSRSIVRLERMMKALLVGLLSGAFLVSASFLAPRFPILGAIALAITVVLILRVMLFLFTSKRSGP